MVKFSEEYALGQETIAVINVQLKIKNVKKRKKRGKNKKTFVNV